MVIAVEITFSSAPTLILPSCLFHFLKKDGLDEGILPFDCLELATLKIEVILFLPIILIVLRRGIHLVTSIVIIGQLFHILSPNWRLLCVTWPIILNYRVLLITDFDINLQFHHYEIQNGCKAYASLRLKIFTLNSIKS